MTCGHATDFIQQFGLATFDDLCISYLAKWLPWRVHFPQRAQQTIVYVYFHANRTPTNTHVGYGNRFRQRHEPKLGFQFDLCSQLSSFHFTKNTSHNINDAKQNPSINSTMWYPNFAKFYVHVARGRGAPWFRLLAALQHSMYFRFWGWRHVWFALWRRRRKYSVSSKSLTRRQHQIWDQSDIDECPGRSWEFLSRGGESKT